MLAVLAMPAVASAHVLKVDGHISAELHTDPDDSPISGTPTHYVLFFDDDSGKFSLPNCNCTVTISENNKILNVAPLAIQASGISENTFTFPRPDSYTMTFQGTPKIANAFQPFRLTYKVPIANSAQNTQAYSPFLWASVGVAMLTIFVVAYRLNR